MDRHDYFELLYLCAGTAQDHIQNRLLPLRAPCTIASNAAAMHSATMAALFFEPDLIRSDGSPDSAEYLTPFLPQDSQFPRVVPARTGVPCQIFDLMRRIRASPSFRQDLYR